MPTMKEYADGLRPALAEAASELERAEAELETAQRKINTAKQKSRQIQRAIDVLEDKPKPKPKKRRKRTSSVAWTPAPDVIEQVAAVVEANPEGVTVKDVQQATGMTQATAYRTLRYLRDDRVRLAGHKPGSRALLYKPMRVMSNA